MIGSAVLGPADTWPRALANLVDVIAASPFPMFVLWGETRVLLYNAAYVPILGPHHPDAMGRPFFEVWPEIRELIEPVVAATLQGEPSLYENLPVTLHRPEPEAAWFTFAYSPVRDDHGRIGGALCVCTETTEGVRARRRLAFLLSLEEQIRDLESPSAIIRVAQAALGDYLQVSRVGYGRLDPDERHFTTTDNWTDGSVEHFNGTHDLAAFGEQIYGALRRGEALAVHDTNVDPRVDVQGRAAFAALQTQSAATVSLLRGGRFVAAMYLHHRDPRRWDAEDIGLIRDVAERTWSAVERAGAEAELRTRERLLAFLDALGRETAASSDADEILAITTRMTAAHLGLSNCAYADMDADQDGFTIRGNWHAPGSPSIVGHYQLADFGTLAVQELRAGRPLIINDNLKEIAPHEARTFQDIGIAATICMPLMRGGRLLALMAIHDREPHYWSDYELTAIREVTERSWAHVERVRSEALRRDREERLHIAMDAAEMGTWDWDLTIGRGAWSDRTAEIMGVAPGQEVTPELRYNSIHPDDREWVGRAVTESIQSGRDFATEYRIVRPDGEVRWIASRGRVQMNAEGRAIRTTGTVRDVTRRRRAQDELQQLNDRLEQEVAAKTAERDRMWRLSRDLFVVIGRGGEIRAINPAVERLLGYKPSALVGTSFATFVHPDDLRAAAGPIRAAASQPVGDFSARLRNAAGEWRDFSWTAAPAEGEAYVIGRDVTAEVERKRDLELAQHALRESQKLEALGKLTGGVAHDFNNLLTPIVGSLDLLSRAEGLTERQRKLVTAGLESAERARVLVQRLLAFARRQPLKVGPVDMVALINGMADLIGSTSGPHIDLRVSVDPQLPLAQGDANQLELAILNLAVNARDAMPAGGTLSITAAEAQVEEARPSRLRAGRYVRIGVADTGTGMDADTLARAVEPFFSTKGIGKGTGLGLSMVDGLASQLGGAMLIESRPGLGTRVDIYVPVSSASRQSDASPVASEAFADGAGTILLVDDDAAARATTRELLVDLGYRVHEASSGQEAFSLLDRGDRYDAILSDQLMPGMTGSELAARIRTRWPGTPFLLVSGYADLDSISPDLPRLAKPFRGEQLRKELQALGL
ncbi:PAS domain-containing protein [Sphingomonas sp. ID1715]|uniref:PAS domain-containing protein n=1 Tax=Sphingomonas sp. ID1715 TaxID=1656898 RepID=UPI001C2BEFDD|nr:PAS domain-containing protein [Sphingomonas sp. ID1715]